MSARRGRPADEGERLLRARLAEAEGQLLEARETLDAIQSGQVDALVVRASGGDQIFTLQSADRSFRRLVETMHEGAMIVSPEGTVLYANRTVAELFGQPLERLMGADLGRALAGVAAETTDRLLSPGAGGVVLEALLERGQGADGVCVRLSSTEAEGLGVYLVVTDLTEQKRHDAVVAAERLRGAIEKTARAQASAERARFLGLLTGSPAAVVLTRGPGRAVEFINDAARALVGDSAPPGRGQGGAEQMATCRALIDEAFFGGQAVTRRELPLGPPGEGQEPGRFFDVTCQPIRESGGGVEGVASFAFEVTEQVLARRRVEGLVAELTAEKAELARSEARFRTMQLASPDGFMVLESVRGADRRVVDFRFLYANPAAERLVGRSNDQLAGRRLLDEMPDTRPDGLFDEYVRVAETGEPLTREVQARHAGQSMVVRLSAARTGDGFCVTFHDVTERRRFEEVRARVLEQEREARARAEEASRGKDEFLATVSHELRTPLNAMLGWSRMLRAGAVAEPMQARALEAIERNAVAQAQLIEDLLDISRIITGKLRLEVQELELGPAIDAAIDSVRPAIEAKQQSLHRVVDPSAGPVTGDPQRLQQVVWNLLSNAVKFTPRGGRISLSLAPVDSHIELVVSDSGQGIAAEFLPHVFERFRQADGSTTRRHGGLGLGLSIVRQLVELHGGSIEADSRGPGKGSTFTVKLPRAPLRAAAEGAPRTHPRAPVAPSFECPAELRGLRVLVVDDEADTRELLAAVLTGCGAVVTEASSGEEALAQIARGAQQVVLSDIGMPGMDGYAFVERMRAMPGGRGRSLPAAALTAYARVEDRRRALQAGFTMHLPKPVEPAELVAVVASLARIGEAMR